MLSSLYLFMTVYFERQSIIYDNLQTIYFSEINLFVRNAPFLYPVKVSENRKGALGTNGLKLQYVEPLWYGNWDIINMHILLGNENV